MAIRKQLLGLIDKASRSSGIQENIRGNLNQHLHGTPADAFRTSPFLPWRNLSRVQKEPPVSKNYWNAARNSVLNRPDYRVGWSKVYNTTKNITGLFGSRKFSSLVHSSTQGTSTFRSGQALGNPLFIRGCRFYYVDRYGVRHFKRRGPLGWVAGQQGGQFSQRLATIVVVIGGVMTIVYYTHLEVVPYTNRKHFVLISPQTEVMLGEMTFNDLKKQFKNKILPPYHPAVVRVTRIAQKSIEAAMEGIHAGGTAQLEYSTETQHHLPASRKRDHVWGSTEELEIPKYLNVVDNDIDEPSTNDIWIEETRKDGLQKGRKASTKHVDNFKWEIVVVDAPVVNAACLPGGKIIVFTGILKAFPYDEEVATVIGHEVGHAIARHTGETLTRSIFIGFFELLLLAIVQIPNVVGTASDLLLRLPFSRKMEMEADHIGVLLMAAAGYDPRVAPSVYLKLGELQKLPEFVQYISTHPSGKKRAEALLKSRTMQEAISIYESKRGGWDSLGFLM